MTEQTPTPQMPNEADWDWVAEGDALRNRDALRQVLALHAPRPHLYREDGPSMCGSCASVRWPCATAQVVLDLIAAQGGLR